ncbi:ABC transporter permease [Virgibacillus kekensis]|uniref:ABC transporter permease n=1 Tax=Virgibacillus kekensis TaxID=202261 RepID=A0ABV9DIV8_9BACI
MLKFIWNSWWRNKERLLLVIIGALIVSIGLSYLVGITQANKGTIVDELQKRWKSSYHIVVRPPDTRSVTEDKNLLEPNYLSGLSGGISLEQLQEIRNIPEVNIAAPISMMGYVHNSTTLDKAIFTEPGVYRMTIKKVTNNGIENVTQKDNVYFTVGSWSAPSDASEYGVTRYTGEVSYGTDILIAGIDPEAEAALVGLDQALVNKGKSTYISNTDNPQTFEVTEGVEATSIPVLLSNQQFVDGNITYTFERLELSEDTNLTKTMESVKESGGRRFLEKQSGKEVEEYTYTTEETHEKIVNQIVDGSTLNESHWMMFKPSSIDYRPISSPYPERWPFTYEVKPYTIPEDSLLAVNQSYRPVTSFGKDSSEWPRLQFDFKGIFDPGKLEISKDPLTELPMETYFPSKAEWVLDKNEKPVNPPQQMKPLNNPYGFLTKPPLMLTTIEAAANVLGENPISAVRVKVSGINELTEESEKILQAVADQIEKDTGLITDITLGSSPQPALTHIPGVENGENIGWIQQPWIKLGSSVSIFKESKVSMSGIIASVILVAIVYVFSSNIIMMYARKKEFAVLLSIGWRPNQLTRLLFTEAALIGLFVSMISWLILGYIYVTNDIQTSGWRLLLIGVFGIAIYLLGAMIPGFLVRKISPYETMKTGEITHQKRYLFKTTSVIAMSLNNLLGKWKRSILSILAIALPTGLLVFFLFITFRLQGIMYTTWLGEYVAMEVGTMHYVAMGVAIAIAILTTAEIIWQNVAERQPELAVLKAVGWQNSTVRWMVLMEGALNGLIAGVLGISLAFGMVSFMYGQLPKEELPYLVGTIIIPILTGVIGALLPASKAVKLQPYQGMTGTMVNTKKAEKSFQYTFSTVGILLFVGIIALLTQAIPHVEEKATPSQPVESGAVKGTEGEVQEVISSPEEKEADGAKSEEDSEKPVPETIIEEAYRSLQLGEKYEGYDYYMNFELAETPKGVTKKTPDNQLITLMTDVKNDNLEEGLVSKLSYQPHFGYYYLVDGEGNKYKPVHYKSLVAEKWENKTYIWPGGQVKSLLTYEVPKSIKELVYVQDLSKFPKSGVFAVRIMENGKLLGESEEAVSKETGANTEVLLEEPNSDMFNAKINEAYRLLKVGENYDVYTEHISFDLANHPEGVKRKGTDTELITLQTEVTIDENGGKLHYQPHFGYYYLMDSKGNKYKPVHYKNLVSEKWNKIRVWPGGRVESLLTYEVPNDVKDLIYVQHHTQLAKSGDIVVRIKKNGKLLVE